MSLPVPQSGLNELVAGVRRYFVTNSIGATVPPLGWVERSKIINQGNPNGASRVCFIPGAFDGSLGPPRNLSAGSLTKPHHSTNSDRRALAWWHRISTVCVWSIDITAPTDEQKQLEASETLLEHTIQAVHYSVALLALTQSTRLLGVANIKWGSVSYVKPTERQFGLEVLAQFEHGEKVFDVFTDLLFPEGKITKEPPT
jgi:hypothetical protein